MAYDYQPLNSSQQALIRQVAGWLAKRGYAVGRPNLFKAPNLGMTTVGAPGAAGARTWAPWAPDSPTPGQNAIVFRTDQSMIPQIQIHELLHARGPLSISPNFSPGAEADEEGYVEAATQDNLSAYARRFPNVPVPIPTGSGYVPNEVNRARQSSAAFYQPGTKWSDPHAVRIRRRVVNMTSDQRTAELERQRQQNIRRAQLRMT